MKIRISIAIMVLGGLAPIKASTFYLNNSAFNALADAFIRLDPSADLSGLITQDTTGQMQGELDFNAVRSWSHALGLAAVDNTQTGLIGVLNGVCRHKVTIVELSSKDKADWPTYVLVNRIASGQLRLDCYPVINSSLSCDDFIHKFWNRMTGRAYTLWTAAAGDGLGPPLQESNPTGNGILPTTDTGLPTQKKGQTESVNRGDSIEVPTEVDCGIYPWGGGIINCALKIANRGTHPLQIYDVKGSCRCFKRATGPKVIQPGEEVNYNIDLDTFYYSGSSQFQVSIAFISNDAREPICISKVKGRFDTSNYVFLDPPRLDLGLIKRAEAKAINVKVHVFASLGMRGKWQINQIVSDNKAVVSQQIVSPQFDPTSIGTFGSFESVGEVSLKIDPAYLKDGKNEGTVTIAGNNQLFKQLLFHWQLELVSSP